MSLKVSRALVLGATIALAACAAAPELASVEVRATDYAFDAPDTVPAGLTAFALRNIGSVPHEVIIVKLRPEATVEEILRLNAIDSTTKHLRDPASGILTADPGTTTPGRLLLELQAGARYMLVCNFADTDSAPPHVLMGMHRVLQVR